MKNGTDREIAGDVVWSTLALAALLGVSSIRPRVFATRGVACGLYLIWMGCRPSKKRRLRRW